MDYKITEQGIRAHETAHKVMKYLDSVAGLLKGVTRGQAVWWEAKVAEIIASHCKVETAADKNRIALKYFPPAMVESVEAHMERGPIHSTITAVNIGQDLNEAPRQACLDAMTELLESSQGEQK